MTAEGERKRQTLMTDEAGEAVIWPMRLWQDDSGRWHDVTDGTPPDKAAASIEVVPRLPMTAPAARYQFAGHDFLAVVRRREDDEA